MGELLSKPTRDAIVDISPRSVDDAAVALRWAGFDPIRDQGDAGSDRGITYIRSASGRETARKTFAALDFSDPDVVARVLRYTARVARLYAAGPKSDQSKLVRLEYALADDGYSLDHSGDPLAAITGLSATATAALPDVSAIRLELTRLERALPNDPSAAIGRAKNLIEATAKAVLALHGQQPSDTAKVTALAQQAAQVLGVHATQAGGSHPEQVRRILGRVEALTNDIANLRNDVGDGHGMTQAPQLDAAIGLLAVRAALAWCTFMLDLAMSGIVKPAR